MLSGNSLYFDTAAAITTDRTTVEVITTATANGNRIYLGASRASGSDTYTTGQTIKFWNVMLFDLSAIYGLGNEPATAAAF